MDSEQEHPPEGKRVGAHPVLVILVVILGLWLSLWLFIPNPKHQRGVVPQATPDVDLEVNADDAPVIFRVNTTVPDMNAIGVKVPPQATDSQIIGLLKRFRQARIENQLTGMLPPTTPGHELGDHAIADIYIFSNDQYPLQQAIRVLSRGAHAPGELYPQSIPFEVAMEEVRGHYRIDLSDTGNPDKASLGFADDSGVHSKHYRNLF
ncbi:MAG: hypothetical protein ACREI3_06670 [Nitrospirales bacterium]